MLLTKFKDFQTLHSKNIKYFQGLWKMSGNPDIHVTTQRSNGYFQDYQYFIEQLLLPA